jgi:hypothetical protein
MNPQNNENNESNESNSKALILESLNTEYKNLLIEYKQAVSNYVNFLKQEASEQPCSIYNADSKGISQECYNDIWKKAGCGAGTIKSGPNVNNDWAQSQTLNGLIYDSFLWATMTDYDHRIGCYGQYTSPYIIIGVGTDGNLYSRMGLDGTWQKIEDNSNGQLVTVFTSPDGKLYATNKNREIIYKNNWSDSTWAGTISGSCCVLGAAMGQDTTIVGIGTNGTLFSRPLDGGWRQTVSGDEWCAYITIAPDGSVFVVGGGNQLYKKNNYKTLTSERWQSIGNCCVKAMTIASDNTLIVIGTDGQIYTKKDYKDLSPAWSSAYKSQNPTVTSITTVKNPDFDTTTSIYSTATEPNYNLNTVPMTTVKETSFWGTSPLSQSTVSTVGECEALCSRTNGCSGATYSETTSKCFLRKGEGDIVSGSPTDYSIIPKGQSLLKIVKNINDKLTQLNEKIQKMSDSIQTKFSSQAQERSSANTNLINQYKNLVGERVKIQKMLNEYQTLDEQQIQGNIYTSQNYYSFILLMILAILVVVLLYKFTVPSAPASTTLVQNGGQLGTSAYYIVFGIFILILLLTCYNKYKLL